jgi:hypothetical protein
LANTLSKRKRREIAATLSALSHLSRRVNQQFALLRNHW